MMEAWCLLSSVQFSCSVMSDSLWPPGLQHAWPPCVSPTPGVYSNSRALSQWRHPTISPSVVPFSSRLQSSPATRCFPMSQFFASGGQSIGVSASASVHSNEYSGLISFRMDWLDLLAVQETLKSLVQYHSLKAPILRCSAFFIVQLSNPYMTTGKTIALIRWNFFGIVMSLLYNSVTLPPFFIWLLLHLLCLLPLDCKEIQPVHPKGNQSWIFIGKTDSEA